MFGVEYEYEDFPYQLVIILGLNNMGICFEDFASCVWAYPRMCVVPGMCFCVV